MVSKTYVDFPSSECVAPTHGSLVGPVPADEKIEISLYLKPRHDPTATDQHGGDLRANMRARRTRQHGDDIKLIQEFAHETGLTIVTIDPARRLIRLTGSVARMEAAFHTKLHHFHDGKTHFRSRTGRLRMPSDVAHIVESVLGLDTHPIAQPRLIRHPNAAAQPSYLPNQVATLYNYPTGVTGAGQCIALIELGGGFTTSDIDAAFQAMGLTPPTVVAVSVDGGTNAPTPDDGANAEVALDIQVCGGVAPGAKIAVYFAPNTDVGFVDAISAAAQDETNKPSVISISWGSPESSWTAQSQQSMTSALADAGTLNVSVFVASGDNLATDGVTDGKAHVDFPASSPNAIGCGGTVITVRNDAITTEAVWNDATSGGGGGISDVYPVPSFQENVTLPSSVNDGHSGRGVPDVSGDASPESGYKIVVNGAPSVVGGTSAVAPLWAGLTALINQKAATPIGFFLPFLYSNASLLRDITSGTNIPSGSTVGYRSGPGWDACTGLGVPDGQALFAALTTAATPTPTPTPVSTSTETFTYTLTVTLGAKPVLSLAPSASPTPTPAPVAGGNMLGKINHVVVLMLENRSFDHMLGYLYADSNNVSPAGQSFEGLIGEEANSDANGNPVSVYRIQSTDQNSYFMPGADPGEGYAATNSQLFGATTAPTPPVATNQGFISDFAYTLGWQSKESGWSILPGTVANNIMGMFTPQMLPVLSGLARGFAVCDHWFASAPTETMPNRAFVCAATSQGHMDDKAKSFTAPSIFGLMSQHGVSWSIYGYNADPLTRSDFTDIQNAEESHFGLFTDFQSAAANGTLASYVFLEPSWEATGNSQHPNYNVALGEQLIHDVYTALRNGPAWNETLLIITYDEHGGCYDHVPPPSGAVPPDSTAGEYGFDFTRFGVRVPTVLVSPLIAAGTVFRVPAGSMPFDHTSILKTLETRWNLPALTARDAAAPDIGGVLTLDTPRTDDPLAGVTVPSFAGDNPAFRHPSHLMMVHAELVSQLLVPDAAGGAHHKMPELKTANEARHYIDHRIAAWKASKQG